MYDKDIEIPPAGEKADFPRVKGKALQVLYLDFPDSSNPVGNPRIVADAGRVDARMSVGDPITDEVDGIVVENNNSVAAGTVATVRVYEGNEKVIPVHKPKVRVGPRSPDLEYQHFDLTVELGPDGNYTGYSTVSENPNAPFRGSTYDRRLIGLTCGIYKTNNVADPFRVEVQVEVDEQEVRGYTFDVPADSDRMHTIAENILIMRRPLDIGLYAQDGGSGWAEFNIRGVWYRDKNNTIPAR